jgi:sugar-specific transcriptional regulator TrmB
MVTMGETLLSNDEVNQALINLGLTVLQAKVYLTLTKLGSATGRTTSMVAKVAPPDIYRVLSELHEKGLIEKIVAKPSKYRAMPLREGVSMLIERRQSQTAELRKIMFKVSERCLNLDRQGDTDEADFFILAPGKEAFKKKVVNLFETAKTSIDLMANFQESMSGHEHLVKLEVEKLANGVKIREILSKTKEYKTPKCFLTLQKREPAYQVRYINSLEPANILIKDNKEVFISTKINAKIGEQPHLCSNNPVLVRIIKQWYDFLWEKSSEKC